MDFGKLNEMSSWAFVKPQGFKEYIKTNTSIERKRILGGDRQQF